MAVGNGTSPGVNNKTIDYLVSKKGSRFGVVLYDYYGSDARLGPATLGWDLNNSSTLTTTKPGGALASIPSRPYSSYAPVALLSILVFSAFV